MRIRVKQVLWGVLLLTGVPASSTASDATSITTVEEAAGYLHSRPRWGTELEIAGGALGPQISGTEANGQFATATAIAVQTEYQPPQLQGLGVFGIGPTLTFYPAYSTSPQKPDYVNGWAPGAEIRYQGRFTDNQFLVPMLSANAEYFQYRLRTGETGGFLATGGTGGLWLLLNSLDSTHARSLYKSTGISRNYLTVEYRKLTGASGAVAMANGGYYIGLRIEY